VFLQKQHFILLVLQFNKAILAVFNEHFRKLVISNCFLGRFGYGCSLVTISSISTRTAYSRGVPPE
jgi:hypothetical protein